MAKNDIETVEIPGFDKVDYEYGKKAIDEWINTHLWNKEYIPMVGYYLKKLPIVIFYHPDDFMPWSVQFAGNGHYFKTKEEAIAYFCERIKRSKDMRDRRREYKREWMHDHPGKAKEYRMDCMRRRALKELRALTVEQGGEIK